MQAKPVSPVFPEPAAGGLRSGFFALATNIAQSPGTTDAGIGLLRRCNFLRITPFSPCNAPPRLLSCRLNPGFW